MNNKARRAWGALLLANLFFVPMVLADLDPVQQSALDAQAARLKATIDADIETLETYLADDLTYAHNTGWVESKSEYLVTVESGILDYLSATPRDVEVRVYGDIAVLTGLADMTGLYRGERVVLTIRFLEVSRRVGESWQLTAWQSVKYTDHPN